MLRAIEAMDVARLPARVYIRGFVQAYAREVGLDPEVMARRYLSALDALTPAEAPQNSGTASAPPVSAGSRPRSTSRQVVIDELRQQNRWVFLAAAAFLAYLAIVSRGDRLPHREVVSREPASTASPSGQMTTAAPEAGVSAMPSPAPASAARSDLPLRIELAADGPCWLQATVDGKRVIYRLLAPGERHTLTVQREAVLRVGDPAVLRLSINGELAGALGSPGQPVTVRITPDSYRALLDS
jgi:cytoskeletal protein RodZ